DLRSSLEASTFLKELRLLLTYIGVSDCNMQEGSLRVDANINLHIDTPKGKVATPIVEIKNMNSFRAVERALDYEAPRQYREWQETARVLGEAPKQTRGWDDVAGVTRAQRSKEESSDYRYFPDPDLVPVVFSAAQIDAAKASLGELPAALRSRLETEYGLPAYDADVIVNQGQPLVAYYRAVADACGDGKLASNWVTQDVLRVLKERDWSLETLVQQRGITSDWLADLINKTILGEFPRSQAKQIFDAKVRTVEINITMQIEITDSVGVVAQKIGISRVDDSELTELCRQLLAANPKVVADVLAGNSKAVSSLIGQAKKSNPNVDPNRVREVCLELINATH
ncbi:MAG: Asp-tRNA(Asn)/Glu-tRNA(Gln) amidotransferase GatCAB subunit B, partial [Pirellulales bacterium]